MSQRCSVLLLLSRSPVQLRCHQCAGAQEHTSWQGIPSCSPPEPLKVASSQGAVSHKAHVQECNSRELYLANHLFTNSSNVEDKAPSSPRAPERGSQDTLAAICRPAVKAWSSPLLAPAGTALCWPVLRAGPGETSSCCPHLMAKV